jgi:hypothetical protein
MYRVLHIVLGLDGVVCCYLWGYSVSCWYIVSYMGLLCSMPNSFICISCLLARNICYFSRLFRNFLFLAVLKIVSVLSMLPYVCPVSDICREYHVSDRLLRTAWICSLYLVLNVLRVCPVYESMLAVLATPKSGYCDPAMNQFFFIFRNVFYSVNIIFKTQVYNKPRVCGTSHGLWLPLGFIIFRFSSICCFDIKVTRQRETCTSVVECSYKKYCIYTFFSSH